MTVVEKPMCSNCWFYRNEECHRTPPHLSDGMTVGVWPIVMAENWCGEHRRVPEQPHVFNLDEFKTYREKYGDPRE